MNILSKYFCLQMASRDAMINIQFDNSSFDKDYLVLTGVLKVKIEERNDDKNELLCAIALDAFRKGRDVCKASCLSHRKYPGVMTALYLKSREKVYLSSSERTRGGANPKMIQKLISKLDFIFALST